MLIYKLVPVSDLAKTLKDPRTGSTDLPLQRITKLGRNISGQDGIPLPSEWYNFDSLMCAFDFLFQ
jgi:hypothetical protein